MVKGFSLTCCGKIPISITFVRYGPLAGLFAPVFMADVFGLLHFRGYCLRFSIASDKFARGVLLWCERPSFGRQKAIY